MSDATQANTGTAEQSSQQNEAHPHKNPPHGNQSRGPLRDHLWEADAQQTATPEQIEASMLQLRQFHFSGKTPAEKQSHPDHALLPALLSPYWDASYVRYDYPLFLSPQDETTPARCITFAALLDELTAQAGLHIENARILCENLGRLERIVRQALLETSQVIEALPILTQACQTLQEALKLNEDNATKLTQDLRSLCEQVHPKGLLLGFHDDVTFDLFRWSIDDIYQSRHNKWLAHIEHLCAGLKAKLLIEQDKKPEAREAEALRQGIGAGVGRQIDFSKLANVLGSHRGTRKMPVHRENRIRSLLKTLRDFQSVAPTLLPTLFYLNEHNKWSEQSKSYQCIKHESPCHAAEEFFIEHASSMAHIFKAIRIATLELENNYRDELHDAWFDEFDWSAFSKEEMLLLPPILVLQSVESLVERELADLSRLFSLGFPIRVIALQQPTRNPTSNDDPLAGVHLEPGYIGISHREVLVHHSSPVRPQHLLHGWHQALHSTRASLHILPALPPIPKLSRAKRWLYSGAMLEGRAHPLFLYNPETGERWAHRFDFEGNPQQESDWPNNKLAFKDSKGNLQNLSLHFTFADCALLDPACAPHFMVAPLDVPTARLQIVEHYLTLDEDEALQELPFLWAADAEGCLHRLVLSRRLVFACRQRRDYWHTLQEMAGVHNEYVNMALEKARQEAASALEAERLRLETEYNAALLQVRNESASEVMQRLATMLLGVDLESLTAPLNTTFSNSTMPPKTSSSQPSAQKEADGTTNELSQEPAQQEEPEQELSFDEPWIKSVLCTSCDDCIKINPQLFGYNGNKQAEILDPKAGTFGQLVEAAEKCPASCIHPGKPMNPDEPHLEELLERANAI